MRFIIFSPNAHTLIYLYINIVTSAQYVSCSLQYASCAVLYALCMTLYASLAVQKFTRFHTLSWCTVVRFKVWIIILSFLTELFLKLKIKEKNIFTGFDLFFQFTRYLLNAAILNFSTTFTLHLYTCVHALYWHCLTKFKFQSICTYMLSSIINRLKSIIFYGICIIMQVKMMYFETKASNHDF